MPAMSGFFEVILIFQTVSEVKALGAFAFVHFPQCMLFDKLATVLNVNALVIFNFDALAFEVVWRSLSFGFSRKGHIVNALHLFGGHIHHEVVNLSVHVFFSTFEFIVGKAHTHSDFSGFRFGRHGKFLSACSLGIEVVLGLEHTIGVPIEVNAHGVVFVDTGSIIFKFEGLTGFNAD